MATVTTVTYSANTALAIDLSNLGTSATWVAGQESTEQDNTANKYVDVLVNVKGITGHASTAPVAGASINVYVWGSQESLGTTAIDTLNGTTSTATLAHAAVLSSLRSAGSAVVTVNTAALVYYITPFSIAPLFGGNMPKFWGLFVSHSHAGALGASNNSLFSYTGITYTHT